MKHMNSVKKNYKYNVCTYHSLLVKSCVTLKTQYMLNDMYLGNAFLPQPPVHAPNICAAYARQK